MSTHKWEDELNNYSCGSCARHRAVTICNNPDSAFYEQEMIRNLKGRMNEFDPNYCGVWVGGSRFPTEVYDSSH